MTDLDPAAVMATHYPMPQSVAPHTMRHALCRECSDGDPVAWPCTPYLLAEALVAAQEDVARLSAYSAAAFDQRDAAQDALAASEVKVARVEQERDNFWEGVRSFMRQADRIIDLLRGKPDDLMIRVDRIRDALQGTSQPFADQPEQAS